MAGTSRIYKPLQKPDTATVTPSDSITPAFKSSQTADKRYFKALRKLVKVKD